MIINYVKKEYKISINYYWYSKEFYSSKYLFINGGDESGFTAATWTMHVLKFPLLEVLWEIITQIPIFIKAY